MATCDPLGLVARPLQVLHRKSRRDDFAYLAGIVDAEEMTAVLCGLPLNTDGSEGSQARTVRKWAMRLAYALRILCERPVPIILWDERLTTFAAQEIMREHHIVGEDDAVAAAIILQSYLDAIARDNVQEVDRIELPLK